MKSFSQAIGDWASATPKRIEAVHKLSLEKLAMELTRTRAEGGTLPVLTGNLYRSFVASPIGLPPVSYLPATGSNATAVIAALPSGQPIWFGYTAAYARRINNNNGNHFVERAIAMWPQIVDEAAREVQSGANS